MSALVVGPRPPLRRAAVAQHVYDRYKTFEEACVLWAVVPVSSRVVMRSLLDEGCSVLKGSGRFFIAGRVVGNETTSVYMLESDVAIFRNSKRMSCELTYETLGVSWWVVVRVNPEGTLVPPTRCLICLRDIVQIASNEELPLEAAEDGVRCNMALCMSVTCVRCIREGHPRERVCVVCEKEENPLGAVLKAGEDAAAWLVPKSDESSNGEEAEDLYSQDLKVEANDMFVEAAIQAKAKRFLILDCGRTTAFLKERIPGAIVVTVDASERCRSECVENGSSVSLVGRMSRFLRAPEELNPDMGGTQFDAIWLDYFGNFFGNRHAGTYPMQDVERALAFRLRRDGRPKTFGITWCTRGKPKVSHGRRTDESAAWDIVVSLLSTYGWTLVHQRWIHYKNIHTFFFTVTSPALPAPGSTTQFIGRTLALPTGARGVVQWYELNGPYFWTAHIVSKGSGSDNSETFTEEEILRLAV